ncbi:MAG TPA: cysteinyl-tRNA synthetase [Thermomicrobiaceae bacterium]|nr:cysteinyl-tRNA synthetase [Thermomicrobiaceae bacterium]
MPHGPVALFGSGETSNRGRRVHEALMARLRAPVQVAIVETPAGFQPNVAVISERLRAFFEQHLSNFRPEVRVVAARRRGGVYDPDSPTIVAPLRRADYIFSGPGSPSYTARHLAGTLALDLIRERWAGGAAVALASAAAIASGRFTLPVYEIYKAGDDLSWLPGLDLFRELGLDVTVLGHWNNTEGGADLDTTHCFMGADRFRYLRHMLPAETAVLAIDEHTACILDPATGTASVSGAGKVTVLRRDHAEIFADSATFPFALLRRPDGA